MYSLLFEILIEQGFYNAMAGITLPNERSERLHRKFMFEDVGIFRNTGYKFGRWHDVKWTQRPLRDYGEAPGAIAPVNAVIDRYGIGGN